jgi:hypothetical protein
VGTGFNGRQTLVPSGTFSDSFSGAIPPLDRKGVALIVRVTSPASPVRAHR